MAQKSFSFARGGQVLYSTESIHSYDVRNFSSPFSLTEFKQTLFFILPISDVIGACLLRSCLRFVALFSRSPSIFTTAPQMVTDSHFGSLARFKALGNYCLRWPRWLLLPCCAASPTSFPSPLPRAKCPSIYRCVSLSLSHLIRGPKLQDWI